MAPLLGSLIGSMLSLAITVGGLQVLIANLGIIEARSTLQKLDYSLALAQSLALTRNEEIMLCPNNSNSWRYGWHIQSKQQIFKKISNHGSTNLHLAIFAGAKNGCINILPTGMSYNNGHFTYRAHSLLYTIQRKLIFNQGLRTYYDDF